MSIKDPIEAERTERMLKELQEARALAAAERKAIAWDNAMQRAFKGIVSRPKRHALIAKATARES